MSAVTGAFERAAAEHRAALVGYLPAGFPSGMLSANAMQFFQNKNYLVMVHEFQRMSRVIPLDGRPHREGQEPSFYGDPVGHWEGDTLVIETTNFKRWSLDDYFYTNPKEYRMHSDALRTIETLQQRQQKMAGTGHGDRDAFGIKVGPAGAVVQVFQVRHGKVVERVELATSEVGGLRSEAVR